MLVHLRMQNIALIDDVSLDFDEGLIVLTGETGAGKSILLDGMNLAPVHNESFFGRKQGLRRWIFYSRRTVPD